MAKISIDNFSGIQPKLASHLLADNQGQTAQNARVEKSDIRPWRDTSLETTVSAAAYKSLYQYKEDVNENWLYSTNDLDFVQSPIAGDQFERLYYTGEAQPRVYANDLDSSPWDQAVDFYKLGHAKPGAGWGFVSGHDGGAEYRAYVYTYVSRYGEESGPSPVLETLVYNTGNVIIEDFTSPSAGWGNLSTVDGEIPYVRVYRTNASTTGAEFQYVGQFNATTHTFGTDTFTDDVADADLGEALSTEIYEGPPAELAGLIGLSNGIFAGFVGNELYLSEPYLPHTYPDEYIMSFDYDIIGLGYLGTNIIVLTTGIPYLVSGYTPETMQKQRLNGFFPCRSKRSIVSTKFGVMYASHEGLILIDHSGPRNITMSHLTPTEWEELEPPSIIGEFYNGKYFGTYNDTQSGTFVFDANNNILSTLLKDFQALYVEVTTGIMYMLEAGPTTTIRKWEGNPYSYLHYTWKSKKFLMPQARSFTCAQVMIDLEEYAIILAALEADQALEAVNATIFATGDLQDTFNYGDGPQALAQELAFNVEEFNGSALVTVGNLGLTGEIRFQLYYDGDMVMTKNITSDKVFRIPPGRARRVEVELQGYIPVRRVTIAESPREAF